MKFSIVLFYNHVSSTTDTRVSDECFDVISKASEDGFRFTEVDFNDVVFAAAHFSRQARGSDVISQSIVAKALPFLGPYIVRIIYASLTTSTLFSLQGFRKDCS